MCSAATNHRLNITWMTKAANPLRTTVMSQHPRQTNAWTLRETRPREDHFGDRITASRRRHLTARAPPSRSPAAALTDIRVCRDLAPWRPGDSGVTPSTVACSRFIPQHAGRLPRPDRVVRWIAAQPDESWERTAVCGSLGWHVAARPCGAAGTGVRARAATTGLWISPRRPRAAGFSDTID